MCDGDSDGIGLDPMRSELTRLGQDSEVEGGLEHES
jgi:hypothetical protein